jgi:hypothetical protein
LIFNSTFSRGATNDFGCGGQICWYKRPDLAEKDMLLAARPDTLFTEPHYNGFPAVLIRLAAIDVDELEGLIRNAWRCQAPAALVRGFDEQRGV